MTIDSKSTNRDSFGPRSRERRKQPSQEAIEHILSHRARAPVRGETELQAARERDRP